MPRYIESGSAVPRFPRSHNSGVCCPADTRLTRRGVSRGTTVAAATRKSLNTRLHRRRLSRWCDGRIVNVGLQRRCILRYYLPHRGETADATRSSYPRAKAPGFRNSSLEIRAGNSSINRHFSMCPVAIGKGEGSIYFARISISLVEKHRLPGEVGNLSAFRAGRLWYGFRFIRKSSGEMTGNAAIEGIPRLLVRNSGFVLIIRAARYAAVHSHSSLFVLLTGPEG